MEPSVALSASRRESESGAGFIPEMESGSMLKGKPLSSPENSFRYKEYAQFGAKL